MGDVDRNGAFRRVRMMASGKHAETWDLSQNDEESLRIVLAEHERLALENERVQARVKDLERTAQCAEDMRDASDARVEELEARAGALEVGLDAAARSLETASNWRHGENADEDLYPWLRSRARVARELHRGLTTPSSNTKEKA